MEKDGEKDVFLRALALVLFFVQIVLYASVWLTVYFVPSTDCLTDVWLVIFLTALITGIVLPGVVTKFGQPALGILLFFLAAGNFYLLTEYGVGVSRGLCQ
ncbi:MAG: hypothetical protein CO094_08955 [Anaerolineae bacterium CG_4_9_14_3_um_filter_57_17]|nr:hypothetical protein [bacterium]NCT21685.1 hypothetical protein [bacterium]OIO86723.1 MAG: hypothetical protein AUK01_02175 [Anaerolineae bacterium CG2_30_57_67]PJB65833.1 MAG: hypothetical protein CO094_08955 [Anaerolineae bacterium CG_4_9_14_3_um_filter_57_17]